MTDIALSIALTQRTGGTVRDQWIALNGSSTSTARLALTGKSADNSRAPLLGKVIS